jgi:hypothetical protein
MRRSEGEVGGLSSFPLEEEEGRESTRSTTLELQHPSPPAPLPVLLLAYPLLPKRRHQQPFLPPLAFNNPIHPMLSLLSDKARTNAEPCSTRPTHQGASRGGRPERIH